MNGRRGGATLQTEPGLQASWQIRLGGGVAVVSTVTVPLWLAIAIAVLAIIALIDRLFSPALGWWLRRRANRAIDELNQRLRLKIRRSSSRAGGS